VSMKLDVKKGDRVQFAHTAAGLKCHRDLAHKYLRPMAKYTVDRIDVGDWNSKVYLQEVTNIGFNTVLFDDVVDVCPNCGGSGFDPSNKENLFLKCKKCQGESSVKVKLNNWDRIWNEPFFLNSWDRIWGEFDRLAMETVGEHDKDLLQLILEKNRLKTIYICVDDADCEIKFGTYSKAAAESWDIVDGQWYFEVEIK